MCMCCHKIPEVNAFHLKGRPRLSWNTAALEFLQNLSKITDRNNSLVEFLSEISYA